MKTELESEINKRIQTMRAVESDAINKTTNFFGFGAKITDQTDAQYNDRLALGDFLSNGTGDMNDRMSLFSGRDKVALLEFMNVIANDVELYEKFSADPIKFMKEYRLPAAQMRVSSGTKSGEKKSRPLGKHTIGTTALISLQ